MTLALILSAVLQTADAGTALGPTFIENDYAKALASAKRQKKILFVDAWAPWCHTCIYMKEHVLSQPAFKALEKEVVFASVDTDTAYGATFLEKFPVSNWPTLFFIDPATETVTLKWLGSANAEQMKSLIAAAKAPKKQVSAEGDAYFSAGRTADAAKSFAAVLKNSKTPEGRAVISMLSALSTSKQNVECATIANEATPRLTSRADIINSLIWGVGCALEVKDASITPITDSLVKQSHAALRFTDVLADDTSGLYEVLVAEREKAQDVAAANELARRWLSFLEKQAAAAKSPAARAVFDPHRMVAALAASVPDRALAPLLQSQSDFPADYNPPARLAVVYNALGRSDEARKSIDLALSKCEGPRRLRLYETKLAVVQKAGGDLAEQRAVLEQAVAYAKSLSSAQVSAGRVKSFEEALRSLGQ